VARHFALAACEFPFVLALIVVSGMSKTSTTKWMATAFETLSKKHPEHRDPWISDDKWVDVIRANYFAPPSKEKEEELKFSRKNMVRAIGSQWQHTTDDFTATNQNGMFRHGYMVSCNDDNTTKSKRRNATCFHATKAGRDCPRKPRVAEVFKDEDEMDDRVNCLKKRKRARKTKSTNKFLFQPRSLPPSILISAVGSVEMQ
jgi:hypothetical protein